MNSGARKWLLTGIAIPVIVIAAGMLSLRTYLNTPMAEGERQTDMVIERGEAFSQVADRLAAGGWLTKPAVLTAYARITDQAAKIQAGEYELEAGQTPLELLEMLVDGRVRLHSLTIVEGWTVRELLQVLRDHSAIEQTLELEDVTDLSAILGLEYAHPEGLFFPDTYRFPRGTADVDILLRAHELMQKNLREVWVNRQPVGVIETPYQALILASIVERETALDTERPQVAGVFVRRLEKRMRLQTDPTVIYGLGERFDGNLTRRDLRADTPYNTYTRGGLPPTPIALPGLRSLQAVASPAEGTALYFVATGRDDGSHAFTDTLEEHNAAVASYLTMLKKKANQ